MGNKKKDMVHREEQQNHCLNCQLTFADPSYIFCPRCGQHTQDRLTLGILFRNTLSSYFSLDSRLIKSLLPLIFKPGVVAREFIDGKRLKHLHPSQAYVMYSIVFFFLFSFFTKAWEMPELAKDGDTITLKVAGDDTEDPKDLSEVQPPVIVDTTSLGVSDPPFIKRLDSLIILNTSNTDILKIIEFPHQGVLGFIGSKAIDIYKDKGSNLLTTMLAQIPLAIFLLLPFYALILWLVHIRRRMTYAENLAHSLYLFSFIFFILSVIIVLIKTTGSMEWLLVYPIIPPVYFLISFMRFYKQGFFKSMLKLTVVSVLFTLIIIPFAFMLTTFLTFMFYS